VPELPETETIARDLDRAVAGARIAGVTVRRPDVLREVTPGTLVARVAAATIERVWRRAKLVVLDLDTGDRIVVQPRFTGALLVEDDAHPLAERERRYSTLAFRLEDGRRLHYRDIRRLGTVALMSPERWDAYSGTLGVEPLDRAFNPAYLSALFRGSRQAVKKVLMDQRHLAGVGNIYANEALFAAGIDPSKPARRLTPDDHRRLHRELRRILRSAIASSGTTVRDYRTGTGRPGNFQLELLVYGREGEPCRRCGTRLTGTHVIDGRITVFCHRCQS
jgi:formamidopyrimidine-DNA glycosylase